MGDIGLNQIQITPLKRVPVDGGDVLHALKYSESSFVGFGEVGGLHPAKAKQRKLETNMACLIK